MLSKAAENAIRAMVYLSTRSLDDSYTRIANIAEAIESPLPYTSKIMNKLSNHELVESSAGAKGGFRLPKDRKINFLQVIEAQGGLDALNNCVLGLNECSSTAPCPIHHKYQHVKTEIIAIMTESYVDDFTEEFGRMEINLK